MPKFFRSVSIARALVLIFLLLISSPAHADRARVLSLGVVGGEGLAQYLNCVALPGKGVSTLNNAVSPGQDGMALLSSLRSALVALRASSGIAGGARADFTRFDIDFEFEERGFSYGQGSAALAAGLVAFSAMTGRPLRSHLAVTGDVGIDGSVRGIGGLVAKVPAAANAGATILIIPSSNDAAVMQLPLEYRLAVPIFGVSTLDQALQAALAPSDPAARQFAQYLARRNEAVQRFGELYRAYRDGSGPAEEKNRSGAAVDALYRSYFTDHPQAGGAPFVEFEASLQVYPWDVGLKSLLEVGKRLRLRTAAGEEEAKGEEDFNAGRYLPAYTHFLQALALNPAGLSYRARAAKSAEAHFDQALRTTVQEAQQLYEGGRFAEAAEIYHRLAEITREYQTRYPGRERVARRRAQAAAHPDDASLHRQAGDLAAREGLIEDAEAEYERAVDLAPLPDNAELLFQAYLDAARSDPKPDFAAAGARGSARAKSLEKKLDAVHAAQIHVVLGRLEKEIGRLPDAIGELRRAAELDPQVPLVVEVAKAELEFARNLEGTERKSHLKAARDTLGSIQDSIGKEEAAYEVSEGLDTEEHVNNTPPFVRLIIQPAPASGRPLGGQLQVAAYIRSRPGISSVETILDGKPFSHQDHLEIHKGTISVGLWDTARVSNGRHVMLIVAHDAEGHESRLSQDLEVDNQAKPSVREVWGDNRSHFYHLPNCRRAPVVNFREVFRSVKEAEGTGYKPCPHCIH